MEISSILELSQKGILAIKKHPLPLSDPPQDIFGLAARNFKVKRGWKTDLSGLADIEIENQFPILHSHCLVELWSGIDLLAADLLAYYRKNYPEKTKEKEIGKKEKKGASSVSRPIKILKILGAPIEAKLSKALKEMEKIRNVVVHGASVVDKKLIDECPWLTLHVGDKVKINSDQLNGYFEAALVFVNQIINVEIDNQ